MCGRRMRLQVIVGAVMENPAGEKLAWDFIQTHWDAIAKAGGPFASAEVVGEYQRFLRCGDARSGDGILRRSQDRGGGTHL